MNCRMGICLLSCVGQKRPAPAPARDLYTSPWFCKARTYADRTSQPWFVLSAKYGLVHPDEMIAPYDLTLNTMPVADRRRWARGVLTQLEPYLDGIGSVMFLAGRRYREYLEPSLRSRGLVVSIPMEGLGIGEQLRWLTSSMAERLADTIRFYGLLDRLAAHVGGPRFLQSCHGKMDWPQRGVYFFYESGEARSATGVGLRVTRVGTHGLTNGSRSTLWGRLYQHRSGNHQGSIFRKLVGTALAKRPHKRINKLLPESWGVVEACVSEYIGQMPFLWLNVSDAPGPTSSRGLIERNAIALLSGYKWPAADGPSTEWLGRYSDRERVRLSGLWNSNHVDETYDPSFLDEMESWIDATPQ